MAPDEAWRQRAGRWEGTKRLSVAQSRVPGQRSHSRRRTAERGGYAGAVSMVRCRSWMEGKAHKSASEKGARTAYSVRMTTNLCLVTGRARRESVLLGPHPHGREFVRRCLTA